MNERYKIVKMLYPNYLVQIKKNDKLISFGIDKKILKTFKVDNTNSLILNNLDIEEICEYENNNYDDLYIKIKLIDLVKEIG